MSESGCVISDGKNRIESPNSDESSSAGRRFLSYLRVDVSWSFHYFRYQLLTMPLSRVTAISYNGYLLPSLHGSVQANSSPAIMSDTPPNPLGKGRAISLSNTGSPSASNPNDDVIPILLAANPGLTLNYKKMAALDPQQRTNFSWEHKFRKWRASAKDIADGTAKANDESSKDAGETGDPATETAMDDAPIKKPKAGKKAPAKKQAVSQVASQAASQAATKDDLASDKQALPIRPTTARKGPVKATASGESSVKNGELDNDGEDDTMAKANVSKKRDETTQDTINESPPKKARTEKKGTARVVKKKAIKPSEAEEEISENEDIDSEKTVKPKPKPKPRAEKKGTAKVVKKKTANPIGTEGNTSAVEDNGGEEIEKPKGRAKGGKAAGATKPATKGKGKTEMAVGKVEGEQDEQGEQGEQIEEGELVEMQFGEE